MWSISSLPGYIVEPFSRTRASERLYRATFRSKNQLYSVIFGYLPHRFSHLAIYRKVSWWVRRYGDETIERPSVTEIVRARDSSAASAKLELTKGSLRERKLITGDLVARPSLESSPVGLSRALFTRLIIAHRQQRTIAISFVMYQPHYRHFFLAPGRALLAAIKRGNYVC